MRHNRIVAFLRHRLKVLLLDDATRNAVAGVARRIRHQVILFQAVRTRHYLHALFGGVMPEERLNSRLNCDGRSHIYNFWNYPIQWPFGHELGLLTKGFKVADQIRIGINT